MEQNKITNYKGYIWTVLTNIFIVFIVLAIFDSVYGSFETIILSISILIYLNLNSFSGIWGWQKQQELFALNEEFRKIRKLLKETTDKETEEDEHEKLEKSKSKFKKHQMNFYINMGFTLLIYMITLSNLLSTI
jgi:hypothetical protein